MPGATAGQLTGAHEIVLPDATTQASFDGAAILHAALPDLVASRLIRVADTTTVIARVQGDTHVLGVVNATDVRAPG